MSAESTECLHGRSTDVPVVNWDIELRIYGLDCGHARASGPNLYLIREKGFHTDDVLNTVQHGSSLRDASCCFRHHRVVSAITVYTPCMYRHSPW